MGCSRRATPASFVLALAVVWAAPRVAAAFPAFARAYQVPCATCHTVIPRRNEFGEAFRLSGYRWPGSLEADATARKPPPVPMQGTSFMIGEFPATWIFSARGSFAATYQLDPTLDRPLAAGTPSITLLFGGTLGEHVSLLGKWSALGPPAELFLHVTRIAERPELNVLVGRLLPSATSLRHNDDLLGAYRLQSGSINGFVLGQPRQAIEANGIVFGRALYALGIAQSSDTDLNLDAYYSLRGKLGGQTLLGEEPEIDLESEGSVLDRVSLSIGHWGYWGQVNGPDKQRMTEVRRLGLDGQLSAFDANLRAGVMLGLDHDIALDRLSPSISWFLEATYPITSWLLPVYLYEYEDSAVRRRPLQRHSLGVLVLPLENLRVRLSGGYSDDATPNETLELEILAAI